MSVSAVVKDGVIQETLSQSSTKKANSAEKNGMDKDAFLQLLVAQMKYQDPLEPTSNTEYISQYATFSQVEQMQNMANTLELSRASSMVGKLVEVSTEGSDGETKSVMGKVDYVTYEGNKAFVSIDGVLYSADDVTSVVDETYQNAYDLAVAFIKAMDKLPPLEEITLDDKESIEALQSGFNGMNAYQQNFIANEYIEKLQKYVERIAALAEAAERNQGTGEAGKDTAEDAAEDTAEKVGDVTAQDGEA